MGEVSFQKTKKKCGSKKNKKSTLGTVVLIVVNFFSLALVLIIHRHS